MSTPEPNHSNRRIALPVLDPTPRGSLQSASCASQGRSDWLKGDEPREHCGVFAVWGEPNPAELSYFALYALQHRGQESAGIAVSNGRTIERRAEMGLVSTALHSDDVAWLNEHAAGRPVRTGGAIAHNRYSTTGHSTAMNAQPFVGHVSSGPISLAHNGNLVNAFDLQQFLKEHKHAFHTSSDTEVILQLIAHATDGPDTDAISQALAQLRGAFSLAMLFNDRVEVARDPWGWRPLVLGRFPSGAYCAASETVALDVLGAEYIREVEPGELVTISDDGIASRRFADVNVQPAHCIFEHVYFASPASKVFGSTVQIVRERLGERLAHESPADADVVLPMPDSGRSAATGFARSLGIPYREGIIPNRYVGRTFIKPSSGERAQAVRLKLNVVSEIVAGQRIVVVDDSIVRGTTTRLKIDQLRAAGATEIHLRISCPPIKHPCFFGVDFPDHEQLVAHERTTEQIRQLLGLDSLAYLSLDGLRDVVQTDRTPADHYCAACYSGHYPIDIPKAFHKELLEKNC